MNDLVKQMEQAYQETASMWEAAKVLLDAQTDWEEDSARAAAMNSLEAENERLRTENAELARKSEQWLQEWAAMKVSRDNALTENAALKRPVSDEEADYHGIIYDPRIVMPTGRLFTVADVERILASRTQEAQKGATDGD